MIRSLLGLAFLLAAAGAALAQDAAAKVAAIEPLLDDQVLIVGRVDLKQIDLPAAVKMAVELSGQQVLAEQQKQAEQQGRAMLQGLLQAGVGEIYAVVSLADFPKEPVFLAAPVKAGNKPAAAAEMLRGLASFQAADVIRGLAVAGSQTTLDRLKTLRPAGTRLELVQGFAKAGDTAAQIVVAPSDDVRRVIREMLPRLPDEIGGGSSKMLSDVQWIAAGIAAPPKASFELTIKSRDADSAAALRGFAIGGLAAARQLPQAQQTPKPDEVVRLLTPQLKGDQLSIAISDKDGTLRTLAAALQPVLAVPVAARNSAQQLNNLKQLMLALHNYHDTHNYFPPQAIRSKDGKPLLSWRVAILPFIEQESLYKEFHLDEPWDSEHNKKLIPRLPPTLASPLLPARHRELGLTTYLAPLSKKPPAVFVAPKPIAPDAEAKGERTRDEESKDPQMVFDVPRGTRMRLITDGTSNTIAVLDVNPDAAVVWTKPADLVIDPKDPLDALRGLPGDSFAAAMCDGSVRRIKTSIDIKTLMRLFLMDDGEPLGEF